MSKLTIAEKLNRKKTGLPPAVLYAPLLKIWQLIFNRKLGVKFTYNARPNKEKGPYVLISNHASRVDYLFTAPAVLKSGSQVCTGATPAKDTACRPSSPRRPAYREVVPAVPSVGTTSALVPAFAPRSTNGTPA